MVGPSCQYINPADEMSDASDKVMNSTAVDGAFVFTPAHLKVGLFFTPQADIIDG